MLVLPGGNNVCGVEMVAKKKKKKIEKKRGTEARHTICNSLDEICRVTLEISLRHPQRRISRHRPNLAHCPPRRTPRPGAAAARFR